MPTDKFVVADAASDMMSLENAKLAASKNGNEDLQMMYDRVMGSGGGDSPEMPNVQSEMRHRRGNLSMSVDEKVSLGSNNVDGPAAGGTLLFNPTIN